jgi:methionine-rich copper-binding protein CopC
MRKLSISATICLGLLALGSPAYAHNLLIDTYPTDGSTVEAGAINVDLTFEEAPLTLPYGEGNLIAVAKADTGEQLGAACANTSDNHLSTTLHLSEPGNYKVLWRQVSDDGHVVSGEFSFTLVNNSNYTTDQVGNECVDPEGNVLDVKTQDLLSKTDVQNHGFETGLVWGAVFTILASLVGSVLIRRRQK